MAIKPWLFLPPKLAHDVAPLVLPLYATLFGGPTPTIHEKQWRGLKFKNPIGIAGGVDKNAETADSWHRLGAGFLEVGTVTPQPQEANPGKIMDRDSQAQALWNKMGFPNKGVKRLAARLAKTKAQIDAPLFINIGKNRWTRAESAHEDYCYCLERLAPYADAFVVNISSPNTKGLRDLQDQERLAQFLDPIIQKKQSLGLQQALLVKLSPDMDSPALTSALQTTFDLGIDGWVLTNTTTDRTMTPKLPLEGGVSGKPLANRSLQTLQIASDFLKNRKTDQLLISVGGISTAQDVAERLRLGADLVQVYSSLIFHGPKFFHDVCQQLKNM